MDKKFIFQDKAHPMLTLEKIQLKMDNTYFPQTILNYEKLITIIII